MPTKKKTHNFLFTKGRPRYVQEPDWNVYLLTDKHGYILGIYGLGQIAPMMKQWDKIKKHNPNANIKTMPRTFKFDKLPKVGDTIQ